MRKLQVLNEKKHHSGVKLFDFVFSIKSADKMNESKLRKKTSTFVSVVGDGVSVADVLMIKQCEHYLKSTLQFEKEKVNYCRNCFLVLK